jgi:hypothetical protein
MTETTLRMFPYEAGPDARIGDRAADRFGVDDYLHPPSTALIDVTVSAR